MAIYRSVQALPFEILSKIFLLTDPLVTAGVSQRHTNPLYANNGDPIALSRVCSQWRSVVLDTPRLWTNLNIMDTRNLLRRNDLRFIQTLKLWLELSVNMPVVIEFLTDMEEAWVFTHYMNVLGEHAGRWEEVFFTTPGLDFSAINFARVEPQQHTSLSQPHSCYPMLRVLSIEAGLDPGALDGIPRSFTLPTSSFPALKDLTIGDCTLSGWHAPWSQLSSLHYTQDPAGSRDIDDLPFFALHDFLTALSDCHDLNSLTLEIVKEIDAHNVTVADSVCLTSLTSLSLSVPETDHLLALLGNISCPSLTSLTLTTELRDPEEWDQVIQDAFLQFLSPCLQTLHTLSLAEGCGIPDDYLREALFGLPNLKILRIGHNNMSAFLFDALTLYFDCFSDSEDSDDDSERAAPGPDPPKLIAGCSPMLEELMIYRPVSTSGLVTEVDHEGKEYGGLYHEFVKMVGSRWNVPTGAVHRDGRAIKKLERLVVHGGDLEMMKQNEGGGNGKLYERLDGWKEEGLAINLHYET